MFSNNCSSATFSRLNASTKIILCSTRKESNLSSTYTDKPVYPEILDTSEKAIKSRERESLYNKYKKLNTVEEKLFAINLPKYYGWNSLCLKEGNYPYNFLPFTKTITRTELIEVDTANFQLAQQANKDEIKGLVEKIRPQIQEVLLLNLKNRRWKHEKDGSEKRLSNGEVADVISNSIIKQINSTILTNLACIYPHLLEAVVDYEPRVESFWQVGGFPPEEGDDKEAELEDRWIQYWGAPCVQLRSQAPLRPLATEGLPRPDQSDTFKEPYLPDPIIAYGLEQQRRHGTNIPGFWPGDKCEYGLLSFHKRGHALERPPHFGPEELKSTLDSQAVLASFAWLHAQASYQGFSTFNEVTYPLTTQTIITDGREFSFYLYQLNTLLLYSDHISKNPRVNICLAQPSVPLFQKVEGNEFLGWNDDVLSNIVACYLNKPEKRAEVEMKPYVNKNEPYLANIEEDERRVWLHNQFRHMYSNRPRHLLPYEIYDWERIYKIKFETRPMEARRRPFELDENPLEERKYSDHGSKYIPKKFRPKKKHWTGWRFKRAKKFYPEL